MQLYDVLIVYIEERTNEPNKRKTPEYPTQTPRSQDLCILQTRDMPKRTAQSAPLLFVYHPNNIVASCSSVLPNAFPAKSHLSILSHTFQNSNQSTMSESLQHNFHSFFTLSQLVLRLPAGDSLDAPLDTARAPASQKSFLWLFSILSSSLSFPCRPSPQSISQSTLKHNRRHHACSSSPDAEIISLINRHMPPVFLLLHHAQYARPVQILAFSTHPSLIDINGTGLQDVAF